MGPRTTGGSNHARTGGFVATVEPGGGGTKLVGTKEGL
jgi:hypothetical protein